MKIGIIGLPGSGKKTIFEALTGTTNGNHGNNGTRLGTARVLDPRVDFLSAMYKPKKTTCAQVEYFLPAGNGAAKDEKKEETVWNQVRICDELVLVVKNFVSNGSGPSSPLADLAKLNRDMIFSDFLVVEKRLQRLAEDLLRGKKIDADESAILQLCKEVLEKDTLLRRNQDLARDPRLRGYSFFSQKPALVLFNNPEEDAALPAGENPEPEICLAVKGKLENELARMAPADAREFMTEFNIPVSAMNRVISRSYERLGLISFFTVGEDEVKAWTVPQNTPAVDAAEVIHSDIKKGFIRAEVLAYADLVSSGDFPAAKKKGLLRLEGKAYPLKDGDLINFRFNV